MVRVIFLPLLVFPLIGIACTGEARLPEPAVETVENGSPVVSESTAMPAAASPVPPSAATGTQTQATALPLSPTVVGDDDEVATAAAHEGQATVEVGAFSLADAERRARADLAAALDIPEAEIVVVESHAQIWPDEALGCETLRRTVVEALPVDGYQIVLAAGEETYDFRADTQGRVELCAEAEDVGKPLDPIR